jgi:hypothetical protein
MLDGVIKVLFIQSPSEHFYSDMCYFCNILFVQPQTENFKIDNWYYFIMSS